MEAKDSYQGIKVVNGRMRKYYTITKKGEKFGNTKKNKKIV